MKNSNLHWPRYALGNFIKKIPVNPSSRLFILDWQRTLINLLFGITLVGNRTSYCWITALTFLSLLSIPLHSIPLHSIPPTLYPSLHYIPPYTISPYTLSLLTLSPQPPISSPLHLTCIILKLLTPCYYYQLYTPHPSKTHIPISYHSIGYIVEHPLTAG